MSAMYKTKHSGNVEDVTVSLKWAQIREVFLEKRAFELSLEDFDHVVLEEEYSI